MRRALIIAALLLGACTDEKRSRDTLIKLGFTDINIGDWDAFVCGDDYTYATEFTAKNPQGMKVSGTVCCGYLKGCSVKF